MKKLAICLVIALGCVGLLSSCRTSTVYNVDKHPIVTKILGKNITQQEVTNALFDAGASLGWIIQQENASTAKASLFVRNHEVKALINFNTKEFSIEYLSSNNLLDSKGKIHKNYNKWIINLRNAINKNLNQTTGNKVEKSS